MYFTPMARLRSDQPHARCSGAPGGSTGLGRGQLFGTLLNKMLDYRSSSFLRVNENKH